MATEASQPLKISLPVSAALAQALYNEFTAATINNGYAGTPAQYTFVKVNALGQADLIAAAKDIAIGVIQNAPFVYSQGASQAGGAAGEIVVLGMTKVRAGGTVTLNASTPGNALSISVASSHVGTAVQPTAFVSTVAASNGWSVVGQALTAAVSGDLFKAVVNCTLPLPIGS